MLYASELTDEEEGMVENIQRAVFERKMDGLIDRFESHWSAGTEGAIALYIGFLELVKRQTLSEWNPGTEVRPEDYALNLIDTCKEQGFFKVLRDALRTDLGAR